MKIALKNWLKDPYACALYAITFIIDIGNVILSTWLIQVLPQAFDPVTSYDAIIKIALILLGQVFCGCCAAYGFRVAKMHLITSLNSEWTKKLTKTKYQMFTEMSCARVWTVGEFMWNSAKIMDCVTDIIELAFSVVVTLIAMASIGGWLVIPIIVLYGVFTIVLKLMYNKFNVIDKERSVILKSRNQEVENVINGFEIVRIFDTKKRHVDSVEDKNTNIFANQKRKSRLNSSMRTMIQFVEAIGIVIVILYSIWQIKEGNLTAAVAMSLVMYVTRLIPPLTSLLNTFDEISENLAYAKDYEKIINYAEVDADKRKIDLKEFNNDITISDVGFKYNDSETILTGINMTIKKGQKIGICGASGGGKSTLGKLINRFYEPTEGSIKIDDIDISEITDESYAARVGCVPQDTVIFPGTIKENILYGKPGALETDLIDAVKNANLYDFIKSLPNGFDTEVGPRGLTLSGGQKQRIALARIFLQNPDIIIMDEATSALDNESETIVQDAIDKLQDKTIITIAHRLSTIQNSDVIYVIGNHKILEAGTHEKLVKRNGAYAAMLK